MSDEVLVLNVNGYIGFSTRNEVLHARENNKLIRWWEPDKIPSDLIRSNKEYDAGGEG